MTFTNQAAYDIRCEWGPDGVIALADSRTFFVVDVLSFSTCVSVAVQRHVMVVPSYGEANSASLVNAHQAILAGGRGKGYSLSPASMLDAPPGLRLVLPSPNGAAISLTAVNRGHVLAGCLRNRSAVCARAIALGGPFAIIPAGERWKHNTLRPAIEDWIGAGAIAAMLPGTRSPEAQAAVAAFESASKCLRDTLLACSSGRELVQRGFPQDVQLAAELDVDSAAAEFVESAFVQISGL